MAQTCEWFQFSSSLADWPLHCCFPFPLSGGPVCIFDTSIAPIPVLSHLTFCHPLHSRKSISRLHSLEQFPVSDTTWTTKSLKLSFRVSNVWVCQALDGSICPRTCVTWGRGFQQVCGIRSVLCWKGHWKSWKHLRFGLWENNFNSSFQFSPYLFPVELRYSA